MTGDLNGNNTGDFLEFQKRFNGGKFVRQAQKLFKIFS